MHQTIYISDFVSKKDQINSHWLFILTAILFLIGCQPQTSTEERTDFKIYYVEYGVTGDFVLFDPTNDRYVYYNRPQADSAFTPASTFKICNSLIGLETGVIRDEIFIIPWDSVVRNPVWDRDHDLKLAFENSTVWYYQELARRVGEKKMKLWVERAQYGNEDISGGIDLFWLTGGLRITPHQQIDFLYRLKNGKLPFSTRSMEITKQIMLIQDTLDYKLYGKTGWGSQGDNDIGWFVGFVEKGGEVFYFANCIQETTKELEDLERAIAFDKARTEIVEKVLNDLGVIN